MPKDFGKYWKISMGGYLSGRERWRNRGAVEAVRNLDLSQLKRAGYLEPGWQGRLQWTEDGEVSAWINLRVGYDHLDVSFPTWDDNGKQHKIRQTIRFVRERCRFGGNRPYFLCPGVSCGRRVTKLYWPDGGYILCRRCHRLTYASQSEDEWDRAYRRADKIRMRLGGEPESVSFLFDKPKGMHWRTFEQLRDEFNAAQAKGEEKLALYEAKLFSSIHASRRTMHN